ncbi:MAG: hypothetical protein ABSF26_11650 [Thermoguttaceae bacterium]
MKARFLTAVLVSLIGFIGMARAETSLKEFLRTYELKPIRSYTFLGTEKSNHQLWTGKAGDHYDKPTVEANGLICGWFDPGEHVPWVKEAMKTGAYDFGLVDGYLPAVRYVYGRGGKNETCEMTAFAVDSPQPGRIFVYVSLAENVGDKAGTVRYFRLGDTMPADRAAFEAALQNLRDRWTKFFAQGAPVACDDPDVVNACKASIIRALITFTGKRPHYGVRSYGPGRPYGPDYGDGFPPTIIALADCLLDWGHAPLAREYLTAYFDVFVRDDGRIRYYIDPKVDGCSVAEYGQFLWLVRKCIDEGGSRTWLDHLRPKLERIRARFWEERAKSPAGLISGGPEADLRHQVGVYFHNNGWAWRGLRDIAPLLGHEDDAARCKSFRKTIAAAIDKAAVRSVTPMFIPPMPEKTPFNTVAPFRTMTENEFASFTNYRYWPELLSCSILSKEQTEAVIDYRNSHGGDVAGLAHFCDHADNWPLVEYAAGLRSLGRMDEVRRLLYCHLAGHTTPQTWTAYEQVGITGSPLRTGPQADYCVPVQLVAPRLAAWLWKKDRPRGDARAGSVKYADNPALPAARTGKLGGAVNDSHHECSNARSTDERN